MIWETEVIRLRHVLFRPHHSLIKHLHQREKTSYSEVDPVTGSFLKLWTSLVVFNVEFLRAQVASQ